MSKRYLVLALAAVLAIAVAVPAIGQSSDPTATASLSLSGVNKKAKKALKKAKAANKKANQALNENDSQDTAIATIEQQIAGGGGGTGPAGPPGPPGPPGPAGTGGGGSSFNFIVDGNPGSDESVTADGFTLTAAADNGGCDGVVLDGNDNARFARNFNLPADLPNAGFNLGDNSQQLVTAFQEDGSGVAQFIFVTDDVGGSSDDCYFAGTFTGSNN